MTPKALVEWVTSRPGYTQAAGTRVLSVEPGRVEMELERRPDLLQFSGFFHGGVVAGLIDHAAGGAVSTALPPGQIAVTIDLHVNFLTPADGQRIQALARAIQVGKTVSVAQVEVRTTTDGEPRLCATGTVTLRTIPMAGGPKEP